MPILIYNVIPWNYLSVDDDAAHHATRCRAWSA